MVTPLAPQPTPSVEALFTPSLGNTTDRGVYCNRTINMRSLKAVGYDMDYTLIHYREVEFERKAYDYTKKVFRAQGWPVDHLEFDPTLVCRGLVIDTENGNLVKANRFGFIKKAYHGTQPIEHEEQRKLYSRTIVNLAAKRWVFLNTFFSLSEGCMYAQLVDLLDERKIPEVLGYAGLYARVRNTLDTTHMEGQLKAEIMAHPERYVVLDEETPLTLLDQHHSGKKLLLITNSEWFYTRFMMSYAFDRYLPAGKTWRDLFDLVIVGARKPSFFTQSSPFFEVVNPDNPGEGLLKPSTTGLKDKTVFLGGSAEQVEKYLGISGDEILYVGDHMFGDVHVSKDVLRWRTALIIRELEDELHSVRAFQVQEKQLQKLMQKKENLEQTSCQIRLNLLRKKAIYGPEISQSAEELQKSYDGVRAALDMLDRTISPLAQLNSELYNPRWGLLMRTGNDKSYLAFQLERYADIYTSRVSNLLGVSPYSYLRSPRGTLPHDL
ncbi:MAG: HAD-IG family 5'-nucleotidase [Methylotenera sp.]|nr:HAD-IG family 5'-nucleotidase [Oligoflexia bacterium]